MYSILLSLNIVDTSMDVSILQIHSVVDQYDVVGADRDLTGQYNKRGSLVEALDNPRTSTDSTSLSLRSSTESTIMDSRPMSHFDNEDGVDTDGVILRYQSVPSYCRNRNGREIANSALVRPVSAALVDYENYACYDAHGEIEVPPSGSGINQPTSMTGISVVDESFNRLLSNNLPPKGVSKTRDPFSRLYHKLTANRSKLGEEKQSHSGRTSPLRFVL